jgi:hypothetical protein
MCRFRQACRFVSAIDASRLSEIDTNVGAIGAGIDKPVGIADRSRRTLGKPRRNTTCSCPGMRRMFTIVATLLVGASAAPLAQQVDQQPPIRTSPPFPNRANEALPAWLRVRGEFRERFEGFTHSGFTPERDDTYFLSRLRLNAAVTPGRLFSATVQLQDARVAEKQVGPTTPPFRGPIDLRMAYADIGDVQRGLVSVRAGRQELAFGEQRLIGHLNWTNTARSFDGVRATIRRGAYQVDVFGASVVRVDDDSFDTSGNGNRIGGAYGSLSTLGPAAAIEPYFFWRADRDLRTETATTGDLDQRTFGVRFNGKLPAGLDYGVEMAGQNGSLGSDSISAWAGHWQLRESFPGRLTVRLIGEFNYASGDSDAADGRRGTFDQLYPTGHDKLGLADQVGWRNIRHVRAGFEITPVRGWPVTASHHAWWLANRHDSLYNAGGAPIARVAGGAASTYVGQEIDVQLTRALTPQILVAGGYAHMFTGRFLKEATPGADYSYPYLMVTYVFLAER